MFVVWDFLAPLLSVAVTLTTKVPFVA